jgi:hypothetical protein
MKEYGRLTTSNVDFPYIPSERPVAKVRTLKSETQCPIRVRTLQQTMESVAQDLEEVWTAQQTLKSISLHSHRVQTKMRWLRTKKGFSWYRPNAKVTDPDACEKLTEDLSEGLNTTSTVGTPPMAMEI